MAKRDRELAVARVFKIHWMIGDAKGYTDILPADWFAPSAPETERVHKVLGPKGGRSKAGFRLHFSNNTAILDYRCETFRDLNDENDMVLGEMRIHFAGTDRRRIVRVDWDEEEQKENCEIRFWTTNVIPLTMAEEITNQRRTYAKQLGTWPRITSRIMGWRGWLDNSISAVRHRRRSSCSA